MNDLFDSNELAKHLVNQDCVLSALGSPIQLAQITLYTNSMKAICEAMNTSNVRRLICITSMYTRRMI